MNLAPSRDMNRVPKIPSEINDKSSDRKKKRQANKKKKSAWEEKNFLIAFLLNPHSQGLWSSLSLVFLSFLNRAHY